MRQPFYRVDFAVADTDEVQRTLNRLYGYELDVTTKVLHRARINLFVTLMERLIERGVLKRFDSALDVGCSAGIYSKVLSDLGFRDVVGIDVDADALTAARASFGDSARFELRRAEDLDPEARFDLVLCTEVIEHTSDPVAVVARVTQAIAPGGLGVFSLPNALSLPYLAARAARRRRRIPLDPELRAHLDYPVYRTLRLLTRPGFHRVATSGTNLFLDPKVLRLVYGRRAFPHVNRLNFFLSRLWPLKYASQFFFVVLQREA